MRGVLLVLFCPLFHVRELCHRLSTHSARPNANTSTASVRRCKNTFLYFALICLGENLSTKPFQKIPQGLISRDQKLYPRQQVLVLAKKNSNYESELYWKIYDVSVAQCIIINIILNFSVPEYQMECINITWILLYHCVECWKATGWPLKTILQETYCSSAWELIIYEQEFQLRFLFRKWPITRWFLCT